MSGINPIILVQNLGVMGDILQAVAIMMGLGFFLGGLFKLKRYGEMRTMMSHQMTIWAPLMMLLAGTMLLCLPLMLHTALLNFWSSSNPVRYDGAGGEGWEQFVPAVVIFVRLIGVGAFMRGIVLFARTGGEQSQHGTLSKAILHVIGGILCVNIIGTLHLLQSILGYTGF